MYKILKYKSKLQTATTNAKKQIYKSKLNYYNQLGGSNRCVTCDNKGLSAAAACTCRDHDSTTSPIILKRETLKKNAAMFKDMSHIQIVNKILGNSDVNPEDDVYSCPCQNQESATAVVPQCSCKNDNVLTRITRVDFNEELPIFNERSIGGILYGFQGKSNVHKHGYDRKYVFKCMCPNRDHTICFIKRFKDIDYGTNLYIEELEIQSFIDLKVLLLENPEDPNNPEKRYLPRDWFNAFDGKSSVLRIFKLEFLHIKNISNIEELPETLSELNYLRKLNINNSKITELCNIPELTHLYCSGTIIRYIPETFVELRELYCSATKIRYIPQTLVELKKLECYNCTELELISDTLTKLEILECARSKSLTKIPNTFVELKLLDCSKCRLMENLPNTLVKLEILICNICIKMNVIPAELVNLVYINCGYSRINLIDVTNMERLSVVNLNVNFYDSIIDDGKKILLPLTHVYKD